MKDYINVPLEDMKRLHRRDVHAEARAGGVGVGAGPVRQLFPVVQAVITDKNADIDQLLTKANTAGQAAIDAGS